MRFCIACLGNLEYQYCKDLLVSFLPCLHCGLFREVAAAMSFLHIAFPAFQFVETTLMKLDD